ncbi:hypothetical protein BSL78_01984 [Apostichopus japonicus]|uniref:OTU domain-containing protein n=1 Tax=Stichopus japonicus TaxID=307972 RepID=A0A2G8LLL5_STIJA|nr:hypothetical protein BSL78_01984 [Apostichopus japonicus]
MLGPSILVQQARAYPTNSLACLPPCHLTAILSFFLQEYQSKFVMMFYTQVFHYAVREACISFMSHHREQFEPFIPGSFDHYLYHLKNPKEWAGQVEISALSLLYKRDFLIYQFPGKPPSDVTQNGFDKRIMLCFSHGNHYDSVLQRHFSRMLLYAKIEHPNSTHPVRWLELEQHHQACDSLHTRLFWAFQSYSVVIKSYQRRVTCPSFEVYIRSFNELQKFCLARTKVSVPKQLKFVYGALRKVVTVTHNFDIEAKGLLGSMLMAEAEKTLKMNGLDKYDDLLNLLKQASCFDHNEASAMLGAMYSAGLRKRKDTRKGMMYTLMAAQEGNIMAQCSLGFMHLYGTGGLDQDFDYAYFYLIEVAAQAVKSKEKHGAGSVTTEMVRLTDTAQLQYHSGEKGDYFQWMKFQASKGMTDAQARMGRILYWGSGGVKRNLQAATKYYERTAKAAPKNAVALFDYGVVLLRGQGTEKNITKALEQLNKSAALTKPLFVLGHAPAFTAIGWYKLNIEKDYEAAAKYFEKGDQGGHRDAAHNLAYMYSRGIYPGKGEEKMTAFKYYKRAADKGHSDSSVMLAKLYKEGVENEMEADSEQAAKWAYRVAIEHEEFGMLLRKGLEAFLSTSW